MSKLSQCYLSYISARRCRWKSQKAISMYASLFLVFLLFLVSALIYKTNNFNRICFFCETKRVYVSIILSQKRKEGVSMFFSSLLSVNTSCIPSSFYFALSSIFALQSHLDTETETRPTWPSSFNLFVMLRNFVCKIGEDADILMNLFDAREGKFIRLENFVSEKCWMYTLVFCFVWLTVSCLQFFMCSSVSSCAHFTNSIIIINWWDYGILCVWLGLFC